MLDANALLLFAVLAANSGDLEGTSALNRAYAKQSGLEATLQQFEREALPREWRVVGGNVVLLGRALAEQRVTLRWSFP